MFNCVKKKMSCSNNAVIYVVSALIIVGIAALVAVFWFTRKQKSKKIKKSARGTMVGDPNEGYFHHKESHASSSSDSD